MGNQSHTETKWVLQLKNNCAKYIYYHKLDFSMEKYALAFYSWDLSIPQHSRTTYEDLVTRKRETLRNAILIAFDLDILLKIIIIDNPQTSKNRHQYPPASATHFSPSHQISPQTNHENKHYTISIKTLPIDQEQVQNSSKKPVNKSLIVFSWSLEFQSETNNLPGNFDRWIMVI